MKHFTRLADLHEAHGFPPPENPMISFVSCEGSCQSTWEEHTSDFYMIGYKKMKAGVMMYGRTRYDHDNGTMSFMRPRQVISLRNIQLEEQGFLIYVHEDFLQGHPLHQQMKKYGFFDYETNEALHLSPQEEKTIWELFRKMEHEYRHQDEYSKPIILTHLDSMLNYGQRFYKRQFINRAAMSGHTVTKFNQHLASYFDKGLVREKGLPTVQYLASELNLSSRYLSDLLKQETGKTAIDLIHLYLISEAKNLLIKADQSVSEIAYELGFENPPYFTRLFKKEVGMSPVEFKRSLN